MVEELVEKDENQRYSQFKRLTISSKTDQVVVEEISHLPEKEQGEKLTDHFSSVSKEYKHLETEGVGQGRVAGKPGPLTAACCLTC